MLTGLQVVCIVIYMSTTETKGNEMNMTEKIASHYLAELATGTDSIAAAYATCNEYQAQALAAGWTSEQATTVYALALETCIYVAKKVA